MQDLQQLCKQPRRLLRPEQQQYELGYDQVLLREQLLLRHKPV
jgi:hypothetical protein